MTTAIEGGEGSASRPGRSLPPGKDTVPIVQEAEWSPGPVWTGTENLAPAGIRSPDRPACSQSLYQLQYPAHTFLSTIIYISAVRVFCDVMTFWTTDRIFQDRHFRKAYDLALLTVFFVFINSFSKKKINNRD